MKKKTKPKVVKFRKPKDFHDKTALLVLKLIEDYTFSYEGSKWQVGEQIASMLKEHMKL